MNSNPFMRRGRLVGLLALVAALFAWLPAQAQGFMVKPMRMEATVPAGRTVEVPLDIRNTAGSAVRVIDLRLADISQNLDGSWKLIEPDSKEDTSKLFSSLAWTSLDRGRVEIAPLEPATVIVKLSPPPNARGAYFAAIIAETPMPEATTGVAVRIRFVIPLIIEIEGRPARQQIALEDVLMTYKVASGPEKATTTAALRIANAGRTFSRLSGQMTVERKNGERWRPVTRFPIPERSIIPGMTLELGKDLERRLPSGDYRLRGELQVDGRRIAPLEKEIAFEGDPNVDALAYDTALILTPDLVEMDIVPGATRTTILRIENPGADPVKVEMSSATPKGLAGVAMGDLLGTALSAEPWTEITPSEFTIRPGIRQNVRVVSRVPKTGVDHPNYYGDLILNGTYADGQSAGETRSTVHLSYARIESTPKGSVEQISLAEGGEPGQFFAQMRFVNVGNVHIEPTARLFVLSAQGGQVRNVELSSEEGPLLPLGKRQFSAELDLDGVAPGYYALRAVAQVASGQQAVGQQVIRVETEDLKGEDGKTVSAPRVTLVDPTSAEVPEGMKIGDGPVIPLDGAGDKDAGNAG